MKKYVVDASVVLKSLLSKKSTVAEKFKLFFKDAERGKAEILSHPLIILEVANGLRFTLKDKLLAGDLFRAFLQLPIPISDLTKAQQAKALDLAYDLGVTVYDMSYHILAKSHHAVFLTCDEAYFTQAGKIKDVEFLK